MSTRKGSNKVLPMESTSIAQQKRQIQAQNSFRTRHTNSVVEELDEDEVDSDDGDEEGLTDRSSTNNVVEEDIGETSSTDHRDSTASLALDGTLQSSDAVTASTANDVTAFSSPRGSGSSGGGQFGSFVPLSLPEAVSEWEDRDESAETKEGVPPTPSTTWSNQTTMMPIAGTDAGEAPAGGGSKGQPNGSKSSDDTAAKTARPTAHAKSAITPKIARRSVFVEGTEVGVEEGGKNRAAATGTAAALPLPSGVHWPKVGVSRRAIHLLPYLSHMFSNKAGGRGCIDPSSKVEKTKQAGYETWSTSPM